MKAALILSILGLALGSAIEKRACGGDNYLMLVESQELEVVYSQSQLAMQIVPASLLLP